MWYSRRAVFSAVCVRRGCARGQVPRGLRLSRLSLSARPKPLAGPGEPPRGHTVTQADVKLTRDT